MSCVEAARRTGFASAGGRKDQSMNEMPLFQQATLVALISELGKEDTAEVLKIFLADTSSKMKAIASDLQSRYRA